MPENVTSIQVVLVALSVAEPFVAVFAFALNHSTRIMNTTIGACIWWQLGKVIGF